MPIPTLVKTGAMIAGTVFAATGLNAGVLSLVDAEPGPVTTDDAGADAATVVDEPAPDPAPPGALAVDPQPVAILQSTAQQPVGPEQPSAEPAPTSNSALGVVTPTADDPADDGDGHDGEDHDRDDDDEEQPEAMTEPAGDDTPASGQRSSTTAVESTTTSDPASTTRPQPTTTAAPTSTTDQPVTRTEYLTYEFSGIATIIVALHDGRRLEFWSVERAPGWVSRVDDDGPDKVKIKFQRLSDGEEAEFEVTFDGGELKVKQEA